MLAAWSGLGYYHRARNLHRGARHVWPRTTGAASRARWRPRWPSPASGLYTASAVLSIAYGVAAARGGRQRAPRARAAAARLRGPEWRKDAAVLQPGRGAARPRRRPATGTRRSWSWARPSACRASRPARPVRCARDCRARGRGRAGGAARGPAAARAGGRHRGRRGRREATGRLLLVRRARGPAHGPHVGGAADLAGVARPAGPGAASCGSATAWRCVPGALVARARHAITYRRIRVEAYRAALRREPPGRPRPLPLGRARGDRGPAHLVPHAQGRRGACARPQMPLSLEETP